MPGPAGWKPTTPDVEAGDLPRLFREHRFLLLHMWAAWNDDDRAMDEVLRRVRPDFAGRVEFRALDTESPANWTFVLAQRGIVNLPALVLYVKGRRSDVLIGLRSRGDLRSWIAKHVESLT